DGVVAGPGPEDVDAVVEDVSRDDVALAGVVDAVAGRADQVPRGAVFHDDSATGFRLSRVVAHCHRAGPGDADEIPGDGVAVGPAAGDADRDQEVAADEVALGCVADAVAVGADEVIAGTAFDFDADVIGQCGGPGGVGADEVAGHHIAGDPRPGDVDAVG